MEFGVAFPASPDAREDIVVAEQLGYTHAWLDDSQLLFSDPYVCLALAAEATTRIRLGTGVTNPASRIAPVTAGSIATINKLAPGRTVLGIGTGNTARRTLGMPPARLAELEQHVTVVRELLAGGVADYAEGDRRRRIRFLGTGDRWIDLRTRVPVHVAASGPRALALAGRCADGVILFGTVDPELIASSLAHVRAGAVAAGRDPDGLSVMCMTSYCLTEPGESLESARVRSLVGPFVSSCANIVALSTPDPADLPDALRADLLAFRDVFVTPDGPPETRHLEQYTGYAVGLRPEVAPLVTEALVRATTLTGTAAEIRAAVARMEEAGVDSIAVRPVADHLGTLRSFAREVMAPSTT